MAFSSNSDSGGTMADINVTPLVDVMLVLLIIFMITTPMMSHKVQVKLPEANLDVRPDDPGKPITLAIK
jgi:biopolymer transport protein ExbD